MVDTSFQNDNKSWPDTVLDKAGGLAHLCSVYTDVPSLTSIGNSALWGTHLPETGCLIVLT